MRKDGVQSGVDLSAGLDSVVTELYEKSKSAEFGVTREQFDGVLGGDRAEVPAADAATMTCASCMQACGRKNWL